MSAFILDLETTGLDFRKHRITEISLLDMQENRIFSKMVHPEQELTPKAMEITGKSLMDFSREQPFLFIANELMDFIGDHPNTYIIGHNLDNFDKPFLQAELQQISRDLPPSWKFIDTLKVARSILPHLPRHTQESLRQHFHISATNAHTAAKDVMDLQLILFRFLEDYTLHDLYKISQDYQLWPCFEYRGVPMNKIPLWYLQKMKRQQFFEHNPDVLDMLQRSDRSDLCHIST
jgi:DNA polymerase III epsilon subunit-like protein